MARSSSAYHAIAVADYEPVSTTPSKKPIGISKISSILVCFMVIVCIGLLFPRKLTSILSLTPHSAVDANIIPLILSELEFCNSSVPVSVLTTTAQVLNISGFWKDNCEKMWNPHIRSHWPGQNRCWNRIKFESCFAYGGIVSWQDAQTIAAEKSGAPYPEIVPMGGLQNFGLCDRRNLGAVLPNVEKAEIDSATEWLNTNIAVYVLNLPKDTSRWQSINASLTALGLDFERIPGTDYTVPNTYIHKKTEGLVPKHFNFSKAQANAKTDFQGMGGIMGAMGCATAHLGAMKHALASGPPKPLALVFEDDVVLEKDFAVKLRRLLETEAPCDWNAISLKSACPYGKCVSPHLLRVRPDSNEPASRCHHGVNYGFFAVLYRLSTLNDLEARIARVVWDDDRPHCLDVDVALASISDEVAYYVVPKVQAPGFFTEGQQGSSRTKNNRAKTANLEEEEKQMELKQMELESTQTKTMTTTTTTVTVTAVPVTAAPSVWEAMIKAFR